MSSLRRNDLLALAGLRNDGRKPNELRKMNIQLSPLANSAGVCGSALVQMGLTSVLCAAIGPIDCYRRSDELPDRAILEVNLRTAPFSSSNGDRRVTNPNVDRRIREHCTLIQNAIGASLMLNLHPRTRIILDFTVIADDGGRLCAAINAATCALVDAGLPMKDLVCSCSAGLVRGITSGEDDVELIDLNQKEINTYQNESSAVYLPCATQPQRNTVVLAQCESRLASVEIFERVLDAAIRGCRDVFEIMQACIKERTDKLLASQNGNAFVQDVIL